MTLAGRSILVTRARTQAGALAELILQRGGRVVELPVIAIVPPETWAPLDAALADLGRYAWLVVTSPNGAEAVAARLEACGLKLSSVRVKVAAVGASTARRLGDLGIPVDLVPAEFRAAALPGAMAPALRPGDRVLMARGDLADGGLAAALRALGAEVDDLVAYRTVREQGPADQARLALERGEIDYMVLTSSSTVTGLIERIGGSVAPLRRCRIAVIGPETRKAAVAAGLEVHVMPEQATIPALVAAIEADVAAEGKAGSRQ